MTTFFSTRQPGWKRQFRPGRLARQEGEHYQHKGADLCQRSFTHGFIAVNLTGSIPGPSDSCFIGERGGCPSSRTNRFPRRVGNGERVIRKRHLLFILLQAAGILPTIAADPAKDLSAFSPAVLSDAQRRTAASMIDRDLGRRRDAANARKPRRVVGPLETAHSGKRIAIPGSRF